MTYRGFDGTEYMVAGALTVKKDQPRWWIDMMPDDRDCMCGPASLDRLHLIPANLCVAGDNPMPQRALVKR